MMKSIAIASLLAFGALTTLHAQDTETRSLGRFSEVASSEGIQVVMKKGSSNSAEITTRNVDTEDVISKISNGVLKFKLEGSRHRNVDVSVVLTYTGDMEGAYVSSAGSIQCDDLWKVGNFDATASSAGSMKIRVDANRVDLDASSAGEIEMEVEANAIDVEVSSSAEISLSGNATELDIEGSSAGMVNAQDLPVKDASVRVSSGASIKVSVSEELTGKANSGASIRYKGSPRVSVRTSSGGSVGS